MRTISGAKIIGAISAPPYAQSSPPKPDVEASQSRSAAQTDDSLATNPSAGLVTESDPPTRRRGGWWRAGIFAGAACLAWLAWPTAAFALTNTISISSVAGDNVVTASEKWNGFKITGHTGNQSNIPVVVTFGTATWHTTSTTLIDGNYWWSVSVPGKSSYITDGDNQTVNAEATFSGGIKLSHSRTFNVDLTLPLVVDAVTGDDVINDGVIHITGDTGDIGSVRIDLVIGTGSFINASDLDGEWLQTVLAAENQSYITGSSASLSVTATKTGYAPSATVSRTLTVDLTAPSVSYTAPLSLQVGVEITPITPTTSDTDIVSYLFSNPLPGLSLNGVTGVISGTPTDFNASTRRSTVIATDAADNDGTATIDFPAVVAGTLTLNVDDVTGDNTINRSEHRNNFAVTGNTGTDSGVTVTVTIGGTALTSVTSAIAVAATEATWSVTVPANADYITETSVELSVTATKPNYTDAPSVSRTLTVDLTAPTVSYMEPSNLEVGKAIMAMVPTKSEDIFSYAISSGSLPPGLSLNGVTGVISGVPTTGTPNMQTVGVLATDGAGNVDRPQITFPAVVAGTLTLNVDDVTGDNTINRSEHRNNFAVTGNTGTDSGVTVTVTIGGTALTSVTSAIAVAATEATWSVTVPANADYITETSVALSVTATKPNYTDAPSVSRTLTVDLTAPTVSYTAPLSLQVGVEITPITPTKSEDIFSYAISGGSLPRGLSLHAKEGVISGAPTTGNPNTETVGVLATDAAGNVDRPQITFPAVDGPEPGVTVSPRTALIVPEGGSAQYTLVLDTEPTNDVMIEVTWLTGSGSDTDLTASPVTLTFTDSNWNTPQTVTVSAAEDADGAHGIRNLLHKADSADSLYHTIPINAIRAVEADNDTIGVIISPTTLSVPEGGSATYTVRLGTKPSNDVTVQATEDQRNDADLTVSSDTDTDIDIEGLRGSVWVDIGISG